MRTPIVAGNWKMHTNRAEAGQLARAIAQNAPAADQCGVAVCPPFVYLTDVLSALEGSPVQAGAQDCYFEAKGAFTGEISAGMLADCGVAYVILGHSERRHTIGHLEDDAMINRKVRAALGAGLTPILCVGETLAERKDNRTLDVLTYQVQADLVAVTTEQASHVVIAYEPVWAIGTGEVATPEQAQEAHAHIRAELRQRFADTADQIRLLYGGSVKPDNAAGIFQKPDVDGGLIGGASLKADSFLAIAEAAVASHA